MKYTAPVVIIQNGKVLNAEQLKRYWQKIHHQEYIKRIIGSRLIKRRGDSNAHN